MVFLYSDQLTQPVEVFNRSLMENVKLRLNVEALAIWRYSTFSLSVTKAD